MAVHPSPSHPLVATAQNAAEAPLDFPTVHVWNYDTLELVITIGPMGSGEGGSEEEGAFSGSICCLAFSWPDAEGNSALAVVDGQESRILSVWEGFDASPMPFERKLCDAVASEGEVLSAHFLPESANQLVLTGKGPETGEVGLWSFQRDDGEEEGGGLEKKQARRV